MVCQVAIRLCIVPEISRRGLLLVAHAPRLRFGDINDPFFKIHIVFTDGKYFHQPHRSFQSNNNEWVYLWILIGFSLLNEAFCLRHCKVRDTPIIFFITPNLCWTVPNPPPLNTLVEQMREARLTPD